MRSPARRALEALSSLKLTLVLLGLLMVLVFLCTLDQVPLGTDLSVDKWFRSAWLYGSLPGTSRRVPVFPAGGAVGALLLVNLLASHISRFTPSRRKAGIWLTHAGLVLLVLGEFVTGLFAVETQMAVEEGRSASYSQSLRETELAVVDVTPADHDEVVSVPGSMLAPMRELRPPSLPFTLLVKRWHPNAALSPRRGGEAPAMATRGPGAGISVMPLPRATADDEVDQPAALVELADGDRSLGTWLLSTALEEPQRLSYQNRDFELALRRRRDHLPFTVALKDFRHDRYPGTDIPRNFSSLVRLSDPEAAVERDALIYMNHPLRYRGLTFYQSSFGKDDTVSVFQVVANPGWRLPYLSCAMIALGLLVQFLAHWRAFKPAEGA